MQTGRFPQLRPPRNPYCSRTSCWICAQKHTTFYPISLQPSPAGTSKHCDDQTTHQRKTPKHVRCNRVLHPLSASGSIHVNTIGQSHRDPNSPCPQVRLGSLSLPNLWGNVSLASSTEISRLYFVRHHGPTHSRSARPLAPRQQRSGAHHCQLGSHRPGYCVPRPADLLQTYWSSRPVVG